MSNRIIPFLLFLLAIAALIWPALYNGYPLVYSDTGTYIYAGFEDFIPIDRPFLYCFFVRHISLAATLWTVIIMQAIILCYLLWLVCRSYFNLSFQQSMLVVLLLALLSGTANYTSQIMPDIFSLILLLVFFMFHQWKELRKAEKISLIPIYFFAVGFHFSNVLMASALIVVLFFVWLAGKKLPLKKLAWTMPLWIIGTWCIIPAVNWIKTGEPYLSKTSNIFLSARLIEMRILPDFLDERCATHQYPLCNTPELQTIASWQFLWEMNSPLYRGKCTGQKWDSCWLMQNEDYGKMLKDMFGHVKYLGRYFSKSMLDGKAQFQNYKIGVLDPMRENSPVEPWIKAFYPNELPAYKNARQYQDALHFRWENKLSDYSLIAAAGILVFGLFYAFKKNRALFVLLLLMLAGLMANAITCAALSTVLDRYQARIIGVVIFLGLAFLMHWASGRSKAS